MPACAYGKQCNRKNPSHTEQFHPEKATKRPRTSSGVPQPTVMVQKGMRAQTREPLLPTPDAVLAFWKLAMDSSETDPLNAFKQFRNLRLVGPFELLDGRLDRATDDELRVHWRFSNDLPEMQTCAVYDGGRFSLWRDEPSTSECLLVHVAGSGCEHFANIDIIGDHPVYMLLHLGASPHQMPEGFEPAAMTSHLRQIKSQRRKISIGAPLHGPSGPRLMIKRVRQTGYRPLPETATKIKSKLLAIVTAESESDQDSLMTFVTRDIMPFIQMADDEMDPGMGLEFAHDCVLANGKRLDRVIGVLLKNAYFLLQRPEFGEIARAHLQNGNRWRSNLSVI